MIQACSSIIHFQTYPIQVAWIPRICELIRDGTKQNAYFLIQVKVV